MSKRARVVIICSAVFLAAIGVAFMHPIPQPHDYYNFADRRRWLGIPNFMDVISNIPFLFAGLWGLAIIFSGHGRESFDTRSERWAYAILFLGAALTCFGSAYFHWNPSNWTLVWDRLPMTIAFMSIVAAVIGERISPRASSVLLVPLLVIGAASVFAWYHSELGGSGDLRFYLSVQFFPVLVILLVLFMFEPKYTRGSDFLAVIGSYALAKILEALDRPIYNLGHLVSGHTLKHLAAAMAVYWLARMIQNRRPVPVFRTRATRTMQFKRS